MRDSRIIVLCFIFFFSFFCPLSSVSLSFGDSFLKTDSPDLAPALDSMTTFAAADVPLADALARFAEQNRVRIHISDDAGNPRISVKAENVTVREALRMIRDAAGCEMIPNESNISVLGPRDAAEIRERERLLSLSLEGGEARDREVEEAARAYAAQLDERGDYFYLRQIVALNRPDIAVGVFAEGLPGKDPAAAAWRLRGIGMLLQVYPPLERSGVIEDRVYLSGRRYRVELNREALKAARENGLRVLYMGVSSGDEEVRASAIASLGLVRTPEATELLSGLLADSRNRHHAAAALAAAGESADTALLSQGLFSGSASAMLACAEALSLMGDHSGADPLVKMLGRKDLPASQRKKALLLLSRMGEKKAVPALIEELRGPCPNEALKALELLMNMQSSREYDLAADPALAEKVYAIWKGIWQKYLEGQKK